MTSNIPYETVADGCDELRFKEELALLRKMCRCTPVEVTKISKKHNITIMKYKDHGQFVEYTLHNRLGRCIGNINI